MDDQTFRLATLGGAAVLYLGLLGYSLLGFGSSSAQTSDSSTTRQTRAPRVMYHDNDVDIYSRRTVRSGTQRGGGIRGGK